MSNSWSTVRFLTFAENEALLNFIVDTGVRAVLALISILTLPRYHLHAMLNELFRLPFLALPPIFLLSSFPPVLLSFFYLLKIFSFLRIF